MNAIAVLYQGTKQVLATPMNRGDYNAYRGWEIPADEDPSEAGYLVEYTDGGKPNHPDHAGYISWSPKDVFQRSYQRVPGQDRPPHEQRVLMESQENSARLEKLSHFINVGGSFFTLPTAEQDRLRRQQRLMTELELVLRERIAAFPEPVALQTHTSATETHAPVPETHASVPETHASVPESHETALAGVTDGVADPQAASAPKRQRTKKTDAEKPATE